MHREGHHLNLSVQGNFGSGISGASLFPNLFPTLFPTLFFDHA
jgi:hypothetical protein